MAAIKITAERLRELVHYNPVSGLFIRRIGRSGRGSRAGSVAGSIDTDGYIILHIDHRHYKAHRLAWLYVHGAFPPDEVDHRNGIRNDNRWCNLRPATRRENLQNRRGNLLGASASGADRWSSNIKVDGVTFHLGTFPSAEAAHAAYVQAKRRLHPHGML